MEHYQIKTDREGVSLAVKYDEVVAFGPSPQDGLIRVILKNIIREFDGFDYK